MTTFADRMRANLDRAVQRGQISQEDYEKTKAFMASVYVKPVRGGSENRPAEPVGLRDDPPHGPIPQGGQDRAAGPDPDAFDEEAVPKAVSEGFPEDEIPFAWLVPLVLLPWGVA